ncbi:hypothetical protein CIRG_03716 [Coccidioides immitis RMSCC 2394]|uniref:Uncharacterized protein n=1 Tax=Coccidioides immitis RMSCC 2394 TaxID=404692 RepID=A0A0J6Y8J9_COCIT|nr:hypothetical protein CIRG_03716 [Coccidioides immitis RMSCC 2394]
MYQMHAPNQAILEDLPNFRNVSLRSSPYFKRPKPAYHPPISGLEEMYAPGEWSLLGADTTTEQKVRVIPQRRIGPATAKDDFMHGSREINATLGGDCACWRITPHRCMDFRQKTP